MPHRVLQALEDIHLSPAAGGQGVVLTIGTFDGVHTGHQVLLREARRQADAAGLPLAVLTFRNHPRSVVAPEHCPRLLLPWEARRDLLLAENIDVLAGLWFDEAFARQPARDFVANVVAGRFGAKAVLSGPNFRFGRGAEGDSELLARLGPELGFRYTRQEFRRAEGTHVSSTRIRERLLAGDVAEATSLLGRPHQSTGLVVPGDRLGRTIGFPTANLSIAPDLLLPRDGVYAVRAFLEGSTAYPAMMNLGWRPTVGGRDHRREVHLIGFTGELEGRTLRVEYHARLRDEQRFPSLEGLKEQLARDREAALAALGEQA